jgi:hypothetical protein
MAYKPPGLIEFYDEYLKEDKNSDKLTSESVSKMFNLI